MRVSTQALIVLLAGTALAAPQHQHGGAAATGSTTSSAPASASTSAPAPALGGKGKGGKGGAGGLGGLLGGAGGAGGLGSLLGGLGGLGGGLGTGSRASSPSSAAPCKPNAFEANNLGHHHDINTGDVIIGQRILKGVARIPGGSGCSPIWAGGSFDDSADFPGGKYPTWLTTSTAAASHVVVPTPSASRAAPGAHNPGGAYGAKSLGGSHN